LPVNHARNGRKVKLTLPPATPRKNRLKLSDLLGKSIHLARESLVIHDQFVELVMGRSMVLVVSPLHENLAVWTPGNLSLE
jgi:hypothetical protein